MGSADSDRIQGQGVGRCDLAVYDSGQEPLRAGEEEPVRQVSSP